MSKFFAEATVRACGKSTLQAATQLPRVTPGRHRKTTTVRYSTWIPFEQFLISACKIIYARHGDHNLSSIIGDISQQRI
jgi:hypothetical protein